ncbi:MAG: hypothetical protein KGL54_08665 [Sphingomonadales bacterium]|nr:hypothetical protein [Sphingomonadales bacterium]
MRPAPRRTGPQAWQPLLRSLLALAEGQAELVAHREREWASATFSGTRHSVDLAFRGCAGVAAAERFIAALPDHEFTLPGALVADAAVIAVDHQTLPEPALTLTCELLLLADA